MRGDREDRQFQCIACKQAFSRLEHLTRHSRSHLNERSLKCNICQKGFYRIDALRRHEQIHNGGQASSRLSKGGRACQACVVGRRKCSEGRTCEACQKRGIQCVRPKRPHSPSKPDGPESAQQATEASTPSIIEDDPSGAERPAMGTSSTMSHFQTGAGEESQNQLLDPSVDELPAPNDKESHEELPLVTQRSSRPLERNLWVATSLPDAWLRSNTSTMNWVFDHQITEAPNNTVTRADQSSHGEPWGNSLNTPPVLAQYAMTDVLTTASPHQNWQMISPDGGASNADSPLRASLPISSPGSQNTQATSGRYYVDGDGARLPHVKRRCIESDHSPSKPIREVPVSTAEPSQNEFALPYIELEIDSTRNGYVQIDDSIYDDIANSYVRLCVSSSVFPSFGDGVFPTRSTLSHLVQLYFEFFHPIMPFLHAPTFTVAKSHWLLILAMAALGGHYADPVNQEFVAALHELVRRNIIMCENSAYGDLDGITKIQIKLLNAIGLRYCGDTRFVPASTTYSLDLACFCESEWQKSAVEDTSHDNKSNQSNHGWLKWCKLESLRRTGYCIWLLDCMGAFHFCRRPLLSLGIAQVPLPCQEVLWEAESALDWYQLFSCAAPSPRLETALQHLYIEKRLQPSLGEFSRIILIHALFHRTWEVERYFKQPFSRWTPTAEKQDSTTYERNLSEFLPKNPVYAKWRNSACDCLDILHWHANSVIGAAAGMEHSTVLHLHLARIVLLAPIKQISTLVENIASDNCSASTIEWLSEEISEWALEDHFKARLSIIHAGVTLWHVRRYSADSFYEPHSVWLATITLWAYSTFAKHPLSIGQIEDVASLDTAEDDPFQATIQLDRPADDELVQLFVKGETMKANITGVGNIHSSTSPLRILREGKKLLQGLEHWDLQKSKTESLTKLMSHIVSKGK